MHKNGLKIIFPRKMKSKVLEKYLHWRKTMKQGQETTVTSIDIVLLPYLLALNEMKTSI